MKNVLFITADQWRGDCLSLLGHPCVPTPNLDRLAADGIACRRHFAQSTPCAPSRASLLTGMYLQNHRLVFNGAPLDARHTNVALEARKAGYEPVLFGYTDIAPDPRTRHPNDPDLTTYEGVLPGMKPLLHLPAEQAAWLSDLIERGHAPERVLDDPFRPDAAPGGQGPTFAPPIYSDEESDTAFLTRAVIRHLRSVREPWFVHLSYLRPHPPFVVPAPYHDLVDPGDVPDPVRAATLEEEAGQHPFLAHRLERMAATRFHHADGPQPLRMSPAELRQLRATYYGMIAQVDAWIGRLLDYLRETGAYDSTLVVFTSDHGEMLGDHWLCGKPGYFDAAFHIPLILRAPGAEADPGRGAIVDRFTENVDVMPTILDWIGVPVPRQCDGASLMSFVRGEEPRAWRDAAHFEYDFRDAVAPAWRREHGLTRDDCVLNVLRGERYKYVHFAGLPPLFFDLEADPGEFENLAARPGCEPLVLAHAQAMLSWRMRNDERVLTGLELTPDGVVDHGAGSSLDT